METPVKTFIRLAESNNPIARHYLAKNDWDLNLALNDYYDSCPQKAEVYPPGLYRVFARHSSVTNAGRLMDSEGLIKFIGELGYETEDMATICLAKLLQCHRLTDGITEIQFIRNWHLQGCTTIAQMRKTIQELDHKLHTDIDYLEEIYNYAFELVLDPGAKTLDTETSIQYWTPFFSSGSYIITVQPQLYQLWLDFILQEEQPISKDSWQMLFQYFKRFPDLETVKKCYSEADPWPYIIDEFYEYLSSEGKI